MTVIVLVKGRDVALTDRVTLSVGDRDLEIVSDFVTVADTV